MLGPVRPRFMLENFLLECSMCPDYLLPLCLLVIRRSFALVLRAMPRQFVEVYDHICLQLPEVKEQLVRSTDQVPFAFVNLLNLR